MQWRTWVLFFMRNSVEIIIFFSFVAVHMPRVPQGHRCEHGDTEESTSTTREWDLDGIVSAWPETCRVAQADGNRVSEAKEQGGHHRSRYRGESLSDRYGNDTDVKWADTITSGHGRHDAGGLRRSLGDDRVKSWSRRQRTETRSSATRLAQRQSAPHVGPTTYQDSGIWKSLLIFNVDRRFFCQIDPDRGE